MLLAWHQRSIVFRSTADAGESDRHSVIFRSLMTFAHVFDSAAMYFASSSRVPGAGRRPARVSSSAT